MPIVGFSLTRPFAYEQWKQADEHLTNYTEEQVLDIIGSDSFKEFQKIEPRGTIDLYYIYNHYRNDSTFPINDYSWAKQEQAKFLNSELDSCMERIDSYRTLLNDTRDELSNMESIAIGSSISVVILLLFYIYNVLKSRKFPYTIHLQNPIKIHKNNTEELPQHLSDNQTEIQETPKSKVFQFIKKFLKIAIYIAIIWALLIAMETVPSSRIPITVVLVCLFVNWNKIFKKKKE